MSVQVDEATIAKLQAERKAYEAEAKFNDLQSARLERVWADEEAEPERQRIYDFVTEVNEVSVYRCMRTLSEWRQKNRRPITIRLNTPGGEYISGMALYDYLVALTIEGIQINTVVLGYAASFGAVLLQAGTTRYIGPNAWIMLHEVSSMSIGKMSEMIDETKWTERAQEKLLDILAERSKMTKTSIKTKLRRKDWWLDAAEAVKYGFADKIGSYADE